MSDALFENFWLAGMRKMKKPKARILFNRLLKKADDGENFTNMLINDIRKRLASNQLGFAEMHPTTYLNGERWNDEVISNENNQRPNQPRRSSVVDRAHAAADERERARQARANDGQAMAEIAGGVRSPTQQPIRGDDTGQLGTTLDGTYSRTD